MTEIKNVPAEARKQATMQALREYTQHLDPFMTYDALYDHLRSKNGEWDEPLEPSALWKIAKERLSKRGLIREEHIEDYIRHRLRVMRGAGHDPEEIRRTLRFNVSENCEVRPSDERIDELMTEGEEPDEVGVLMADVVPENVEWLWDRRIPLGKLTLLEGYPDHGKSLITMDVAARVTRGKAFPGEQLDNHKNLEQLDRVDNLAGGVVVLNAEDGLADTIKPRLVAAGADTTKVRAVPAINPDDTLFGIPKDLKTLERAITSVDARLVVVDPLSVFMKGDPNKDNEVRKALTPLADMAERLNVAVVVVRHFNKNVDAKALSPGGGSIGIIGAARSALAVAPHPHDDDMRVLVPQKGNPSKKAQSLAYSIVETDNGAPRIRWHGSVNFQADEVLNSEEHRKIDEAREWIRQELKDGPVLSNEVEAKRKAAGISPATLNRAKMGVAKSEKNGSVWEWVLVEDYQVYQDAQGSQEPHLVAVG